MSDLTMERRKVPSVDQAVQYVLHGKMVATGVATLKSTLDAALVGPVSIVLLGLKEISFLPSITLSYLADLVARLERRGGGVCLIETDPKVKVVLTSLGLTAFFEMADTEDAARAFAVRRADEARRHARLFVVKGPHEDEEYVVAGGVPVVVGSDPEATIRVQSAMISARHAEFRLQGEEVWVRDLGSKSGTFVGKKKIADVALTPGDAIRIHEFELRYLAPGEPPPREE